MAELGLGDTNGILRQPWISADRSSIGLGWDRVFLSTQSELPYGATFAAARTHLLILHLDGPVTVSRGTGRSHRSKHVPAGGLFLHPAGRELTVELGGRLDTVHAYLPDAALQDAGSDGQPVELAEEVGNVDPLVEQLLLALDGVVRRWEPSARTYVDHLSTVLALHLARHHSTVGRHSPPEATAAGLSRRQLAAVRAVMDQGLAEPIALTQLAAAAGLSVSQFSRQFKASTGQPPHRYLMGLRVEQASRLLRARSLSIAEVAARCGFSHQEHLTRVMRSRLGTTPATLRRTR